MPTNGTVPECFAAADWARLNASVGGRLLGAAALPMPQEVNVTEAAVNPLFLVSQPGFNYWNGVLDSWSPAASRSEYAVVARGADDVRATVAFAAAHDLRLAVKSTGHSFAGTSSAAGR